MLGVTAGKGQQDMKKACLIMDEVDGLGAGDRGGSQALIRMIKKSHIPIICICNDRGSQKVRGGAGRGGRLDKQTERKKPI